VSTPGQARVAISGRDEGSRVKIYDDYVDYDFARPEGNNRDDKRLNDSAY